MGQLLATLYHLITALTVGRQWLLFIDSVFEAPWLLQAHYVAIVNSVRAETVSNCLQQLFYDSLC